MSLDHDTYSAFLDDATAVLHDMAGLSALRRSAVSVSMEAATIAVVVHARGDLSGFTWCFPLAVATRVAERMIPGVEIDSMLCEAAASELANVLTGRGLSALADRGMTVDIEPPQISVAGPAGSTYAFATEIGTIFVTFHPNGIS